MRPIWDPSGQPAYQTHVKPGCTPHWIHGTHITVCIELRIGRFLEAERTTQDGGPFNTAKVGVSLYLTLLLYSA